MTQATDLVARATLTLEEALAILTADPQKTTHSRIANAARDKALWAVEDWLRNVWIDDEAADGLKRDLERWGHPRPEEVSSAPVALATGATLTEDAVLAAWNNRELGLSGITDAARDKALYFLVDEIAKEADARTVHGGPDPVTVAMRHISLQWAKKLEAAGIQRPGGG